MSKSEKAFDNELHRELEKATKSKQEQKKMKETINVNKIKYNCMKYALYGFVVATIIAVSVFAGRNWAYNDHQADINKITATQQLKTKQ